MNIASILVLIFLAITFIQSGYDKVTDWKGNVEYLTGHFSQTFIRKMVPMSLLILLLLELVSGILCAVGAIQLAVNNIRTFGFYGAVFSCITLLFMLFAQRVAKDYEGARTVTIYFILGVLGVFWLS